MTTGEQLIVELRAALEQLIGDLQSVTEDYTAAQKGLAQMESALAVERARAEKAEAANLRAFEILVHGALRAKGGALIDRNTVFSAMGLLQCARLSSGPLPEQTLAERERTDALAAAQKEIQRLTALLEATNAPA